MSDKAGPHGSCQILIDRFRDGIDGIDSDVDIVGVESWLEAEARPITASLGELGRQKSLNRFVTSHVYGVTRVAENVYVAGPNRTFPWLSTFQ